MSSSLPTLHQTNGDTHSLCVVWLGVNHAESVLEGADCPHCEWLPLRTLRSQKTLFKEGVFTSVPHGAGPACLWSRGPVLLLLRHCGDWDHEDRTWIWQPSWRRARPISTCILQQFLSKEIYIVFISEWLAVCWGNACITVILGSLYESFISDRVYLSGCLTAFNFEEIQLCMSSNYEHSAGWSSPHRVPAPHSKNVTPQNSGFRVALPGWRRICGPPFSLNSLRLERPDSNGPGLLKAGPSGEERCTPHYTVPVSPQFLQDIGLLTLPVFQGAAGSSNCFSQSLPPRNVAELGGLPPLWGCLEQLESQGTELAALSTPNQIKSNQIKSLLLSHHHSTSALVSEILTSVLQTVQKNKTTIYIWTVHIYRLYRRQCAKYTYIYSVHTVYYKDILRYQCTNTDYTPYLHVCIMSTSMHSNMWRCNRL